MARVRNYCMHPNRAVLIWLLSLFLFFAAFHMLLKNSPPSNTPASDTSVSHVEQRARMYEKMARDLTEHGPAFLQHGKTSQSLSLSDLFVLRNGVLKPNPKPANPPVRANVLYLSPEYSSPISKNARISFLPNAVHGCHKSSSEHLSLQGIEPHTVKPSNFPREALATSIDTKPSKYAAPNNVRQRATKKQMGGIFLRGTAKFTTSSKMNSSFLKLVLSEESSFHQKP